MVTTDENFSVTTGAGTTYTIGGSSPTWTSTILDRFGFADDQDMAEFHWRFVIEATSATDLATKCNAMEAALRQRYSSLTVKFASATQVAFDPAVGVSTGWDLEPSLKKVDGWPHSALARAYDYRARVALPPNFTDGYGAAAGRRSADANYHYDVNERTVVTLRGVWTQVVGTLARAQYLSQIDAYANYRLTLIDPTAAWTVTRREESDPQSLSTLTWSREFSQCISGRRGSTRDPVIAASGLRVTTIRGTYLRTYGVSPQTATANYVADGSTQVAALLAAIPAYEGGPLVLGQTCEAVAKSAPTNEQNDRVDFSWVIREMRVPQSTHTTGNFLDDPNIFNDSITVVIKHNPLNDSPEPAAVTQSDGGGGPAAPTPNAGGGDTVSRPTTTAGGTPAPPGGPKTQGATGATSTPVTKPTDVFARYEATFLASMSSLQGYYEQYVRPQLVFELGVALNATGTFALVEDEASFDLQNCKVSAGLHCTVYPGGLIALRAEQTIADDTGLHFDGVFNGQPFNFLVQPGLPDRTMTRFVRAVYLAASGVSVSKYASKPWSPGQTGWVLYRSSRPQTVTTVTGIPGLGYGTVAVTSETLVEELRYVAANVGAGVTGTPNGAAGAGPSAPASSGSSPAANSSSAPPSPAGPVNVPAPAPDTSSLPVPSGVYVGGFGSTIGGL